MAVALTDDDIGTVSVWEHFSFKDEKHLVFGFDEFPQILVDYLDCCIEQDSEDDRE